MARRELKAEDKEEIAKAIKSIRKDLDFLEFHMFESDSIFLRDRSAHIFHCMDTLDYWIEYFEEWED